jgi:aspartate beta-hydroxylase
MISCARHAMIAKAGNQTATPQPDPRCSEGSPDSALSLDGPGCGLLGRYMTQPYDRAVNVVRAVYDRRISGPSVLDLDQDFAVGAAFIRAWRVIREEALAVGRRLQEVPRFHEIMPEQASISANDGRDWRMYILKTYGIEQPKNMAACPQLAALVRESPGVLSASFSYLGPRKHIPPHRGPIRGIIRFYLVLSMPRADDGSPAAVLKVADVEHRLDEGQFLLWDDTFEHEAWNSSDEVRIVLSLDVWRPRMPADMKLLSAMLIQLVRLGIRIRGVG